MRSKLAFAAVAAAAAISSSALSDSIDVSFVGTGYGRAVRTTLSGQSQDVFAGQLVHHFSNGTGSLAGISGDVVTYCTELTQHVVSGTAEFDRIGLDDAPGGAAMGEAAADAIRDMWAYAAGQQFSDVDSAANRSFAAAFQVAVWEIISDYDGTLGSLDIDSGSFKATRQNGADLPSGMLAALEELFNAIGGNYDLDGLVVVSHANFQDQMVMVPLPAPLLLGLVGLAGVAVRRRARMI